MLALTDSALAHLAIAATAVPQPQSRESARRASRNAVDVDAGLRPARRPHANLRLRDDARGRDGGIREVLAA
jgi:hypothetical protein